MQPGSINSALPKARPGTGHTWKPTKNIQPAMRHRGLGAGVRAGLYPSETAEAPSISGRVPGTSTAFMQLLYLCSEWLAFLGNKHRREFRRDGAIVDRLMDFPRGDIEDVAGLERRSGLAFDFL